MHVQKSSMEVHVHPNYFIVFFFFLYISVIYLLLGHQLCWIHFFLSLEFCNIKQQTAKPPVTLNHLHLFFSSAWNFGIVTAYDGSILTHCSNNLSPSLFFFKGRKSEAEKYFVKAIQLDPTKGNCYMHYGTFQTDRVSTHTRLAVNL